MTTQIPAYVHAFVKILVDHQHRDEILGDIAEKYSARLSSEGEKAAKRALWRDLATSVAPFVLVRLYRLINVIVVLSKALDLIKRD